MKRLTAAAVSRRGQTARTWNSGTNNVQLGADKTNLSLKFSLNSKGGGVTDINLVIGAADFDAIVKNMVSADRENAMRTMAATLALEIENQSAHDRITIQDARKSVVEAAKEAYMSAPQGRDHAEKLTLDMVEQLVDDLAKLDRQMPEKAMAVSR